MKLIKRLLKKIEKNLYLFAGFLYFTFGIDEMADLKEQVRYAFEPVDR